VTGCSASYLVELDDFIEREITPLEQENDNIRFFDHRREDARTDWERGGLPNEEWEALLREARRRADAAGHYRYPLPKEYGGRDGTNLGMAIIREHLARKGLGLHNDLQNEHSIVGNNVGLLLMLQYGTDEQKAEWVDDLAEGTRGFAFGITEPEHGSRRHLDGDHGRRDGDEWVINGEKTWNTGIHKAQYDMIIARTSGKAGRRPRHHRLPRAHVDAARASRSRSTSGRSTCRPTTPTSAHRRAGARRRDLRR
jgi:acyl-CoA dehydrogenase